MNPLAEHELGEWRTTFPGKTPGQVIALIESAQNDFEIWKQSTFSAAGRNDKLRAEIATLKASRAAAVEQEQRSRVEANRLRGELAELKKLISEL